MTLIGPFGAYWINLGAQIYTFIIDRDASESRLTKQQGIIWTAVHGTFTLVNSTVSLIFVPQIVKWYNEEQELRDL